MIFTILYLIICFALEHVWFEPDYFILIIILDIIASVIGFFLKPTEKENRGNDYGNIP